MQITSTSAIAASAAQAQSNADLLTQNTVYTADVAGKTYTADLNLSAGQYVATVPDYLPPITASGSSLILTENNLDARISLLA
jgi:hypothetical protein